MEVGIGFDEYSKENELKQIMNDFLSNLLLHKPNDVFLFSNQYFSTFHLSNSFLNSDNNSNIQKSVIEEKPVPIVIAGPSGVGKGTLIEKLLKEHPSKFGFSVSHTTRSPRPGETHGVQYYFTNLIDMQKEIDQGKFVEFANVHGNLYGTSIAAVENVINQNKICILDIDVQGCEKVKNQLYLQDSL